MSDETVEVEVKVHRRTAKAVHVSDDGDEDNAVWVPLSQCELVELKGGTHKMTLPEWLAKEKRLI